MALKANSQTGREHEVGILSAPLLRFDLNQEIQKLRAEGRWQSGHTAKTLVKYSDFRVVLVAMNPGGKLVQHRTEGRISVQILAGQITFRTADESVDLSAGQMLSLEREIPHDVESSSDSAFLLTIAWPGASIAPEDSAETQSKQPRSDQSGLSSRPGPIPIENLSRESSLDKTLADTFPCSDPLSSIPNPTQAPIENARAA